MGLQVRTGVLCEIQNVLAVLRRNSRFAPVSRSASIREDGLIAEENALTRDLNKLRGAVRSWPRDDLYGFSALELVLPFLAVLRSPEANGMLTDAALKSVQEFLGKPVIEKDSVHASEAVGELVDALIGCRFEETQEGHDEAVRARIIQLLVACLEGGAGTWLPDEVVWEVLQTCMANLDQMSAHSPLLRIVAEDGVFKVVRWLFARLLCTLEHTETSEVAADDIPPTAPPSIGVFDSFLEETQQPVVAPAAASGERSRGDDDDVSAGEDVSRERGGRRVDQGAGTVGSGLPCVVKVLGFLCSQLLRKGGGGGTTARSGEGGGGGGSAPTPRRLLCLRLMRTALATAGGPALASHPPLLEMLRDDLSFALLHLVQGSGGVGIVGEVLSIVRYLWVSMRVHLKVQFEFLFGAIFLRGLAQLKEGLEHYGAEVGLSAIATSAAGAVGQREPPRSPTGSTGLSATGVHARAFKDRELEMVLECLCDFMSEPTFLVELYVNYDCDLQRSNLTEMLVAALADSAYVARDRLPGARASCLASLSAALRNLHLRCIVRDDRHGGAHSSDIMHGNTVEGCGKATESGGGRDKELDSVLPISSSEALPGSRAGHFSLGAGTKVSVAAAAAVDVTGLPPPSWCREVKKRKHALALAASAFRAKPREGLKLLQLGSLVSPGPLDTGEVAAFLRSAPGLDKAAVGTYLGAAGVKKGGSSSGSAGSSPVLQGPKRLPEDQASAKQPDVSPSTSLKGDVAETMVGEGESSVSGTDIAGGGVGGGASGAVYAGDTTEFHVEVLTAFVETFDFRGQSLLSSLRMFLEAFRLPGEAQMIDRILHAFAQRAHRECLEAARGMLASPDVAYLLTFSIIMLNTDLHNPNIRPEKRMTCDGFVNNNFNYGREISGDRNLPRDFLESVYVSIKEDPITTCGGTPDAPISADRWRDLMLLQRDGGERMAVCTVEARGGGGAVLEGHDRDVVGACWPAVLKAASAAFAAGAQQLEQDTSALETSVDLFLLMASLASHHTGLQNAFDMTIFLLCRFTGLLGANGRSAPTNRFFPVDSSGSTSAGSAAAAVTSDLVPAVTAEGGALQEEVGVGREAREQEGDPEEQKSMARKRLSENPAARTAALTAFGLAHRLGDHIREGWVPLLRLVFAMRDLRLLPVEALVESEEDLLEPCERNAFNAAVVNGDSKAAAAAAERQNDGEGFYQGHGGANRGDGASCSGDPSVGAGARSGGFLMSWVLNRPPAVGTVDGRGQYEAVGTSPTFAGTTAPRRSSYSRFDGVPAGVHEREQHGGEADDELVELWNEAALSLGGGEMLRSSSGGSSFGFSDVSGRPLGSGASEAVGDTSVNTDTGRRQSAPPSTGLGATWSYEAAQDERDTSSSSPSAALQCVAQCRVQDLVGESRRLGADAFLALLRALIAAVHASLPPHERRGFRGDEEAFGGGDGAEVVGTAFDGTAGGVHGVQMLRLSAASLAFAEVLIAEIAIRNRERIKPILPLLLEHYRRRLGMATYVTFSVEKAAMGLLRLVSRLFSRPGVATPLARALPWFIPPRARPVVFASLAGHVSSAMRRLVRAAVGEGTRAVGRAEWGAVFSVLEACARMGGRGEADTFEAVCLLVHRKDLKDVLPVEGVTACVSAFFVDRGYHGISNGIDNGGDNAKLFACAALDLLMVLHARLPSGICGNINNPFGLSELAAAAVHPEAAAVTEDKKVFDGSDASVETPSLGASQRVLEGEACSAEDNCVDGDGDSGHGKGIEGLDAWMVILRALSLGGRSEQEEIGMHALQLLTKAVLDDQAQKAPPEVLREVFLTVLLPLGAHVWRQEGQDMALKSQRRRRYRQGKSNRIESGSGGGKGGGKAVQGHQRSRDDEFSGVGDNGLRRDSRGETRCRNPMPCSEKRRDVLHQESRDGRMDPGSASSMLGGKYGLLQSGGHAMAPESGPQANQGDPEEATDDHGDRDDGGDGDLCVNAAETTEEGFELVEAPDVELSPDRVSHEHTASTETLAAGDRVERGEGGYAIRRQFSSEGSSYEEGGSGGSEEGRGASPTEKGNEDGVQLSSPALLALLLVFKSFLMHLPSLRLAGDFHEVWNQFLCCVETLLETEGTAPPLLVDGAVAGLAAVLGEMHREGMFFMTTDDATAENALETKLWSLTRAKVSRFGCCPSLLHDILGGGDGSIPPPSAAMPPAVFSDQSEVIEIGGRAEMPHDPPVGSTKRD